MGVPQAPVLLVSLAVALGILSYLVLIAHDRREKARERADSYQMSRAWLSELYLKGPMRQGQRQLELRGRG